VRNWRWILVLVHRYVGLSIAGFLVIAGLTGAVLTFEPELDAALNPDLFEAPTPGREHLPLDALISRVQRADARVAVEAAFIPLESDQTILLNVGPRTGVTGLDFDQMFVDPATGAILGRRLWGACCLERQHLIPFLYQVHMTLFLPAGAGALLMGGVALAWFFDSFVGLALAWPRSRKRGRGWSKVLTFKRSASRFRQMFDLHRLAGLWPWPLLLLSAMTGASINLREELFEPLVAMFSPLSPTGIETPADPSGRTARLGFDDAARIAAKAGAGIFPDPVVAYISHARSAGVYGVAITERHRNPRNGMGPSWLYIDDQTGRVRGRNVMGSGTSGDVFLQAQLPLHNGRIAGDAGRALMAAFGIAVAALSASGVYLWWRKRAARRAQSRSAPASR
jgi:uncharacterized iron-regulated membrane protein